MAFSYWLRSNLCNNDGLDWLRTEPGTWYSLNLLQDIVSRKIGRNPGNDWSKWFFHLGHWNTFTSARTSPFWDSIHLVWSGLAPGVYQKHTTQTIKGYSTICYMPILVKTVIARGSGPTEGSCRVVAGRVMAGSTTVSNGPVTWVVRRGRVSGVCRWSQAAGMPWAAVEESWWAATLSACWRQTCSTCFGTVSPRLLAEKKWEQLGAAWIKWANFCFAGVSVPKLCRKVSLMNEKDEDLRVLKLKCLHFQPGGSVLRIWNNVAKVRAKC